MKNKTIITTDGNEQRWLETFNEYNHTNYELNQEIESSQIEQLNDKVIAFNNMVAFGPAIQLQIIPHFVFEYIKKCKRERFTLYGAFQYATGEFEKWIFEDHYKKIRAEIFAKAWLESDTSQKVEEK